MLFVALLVFYLLAPLGILFLCRRFSWINKLGAVVLAYILGLLIGNLGILSPEAESVQKPLLEGSIPMALPLLLFSLNIKSWLKIAGNGFLSLVLGLVSSVLMVVLGYYIFADLIPEAWKISGLMVGVYSGGTPNMASIQSVLQADPETYIILNTHDIILGAVYLAFLMLLGKKVFGLVLKPFKEKHTQNQDDEEFKTESAYEGIFKKNVFIPLLGAMGLAVAISAISVALSLILSGEISMLIVILSITTFSILVGLIPRVHTIEKTFEAGMYFILIFSLVVASMADVSQFIGSAPVLFFYVFLMIFGSLLIHTLLSKIFGVDSDTMIITSTALICSPPFVPLVAAALKNKQIIITGLTVGIMGYAIGNYLGITIAFLLK